MSFTKEEAVPLLDKIVKNVKQETLVSNKMLFCNFVKIVTKIRASKDDVDDIVHYFNSIGFLERRGNMIYVLNDSYGTKSKNEVFKIKPGRPRKLSYDEIELIREKYKPNEFGVRRIAEMINKKREKEELEPITHMSVYNYVEELKINMS